MSNPKEFEHKLRITRDELLRMNDVLTEDESLSDFIIGAAMNEVIARTQDIEGLELYPLKDDGKVEGEWREMGLAGQPPPEMAKDENSDVLAQELIKQIVLSLDQLKEQGGVIPVSMIPDLVESISKLKAL